jgi:hypothetical protein
VCYGGGTGASPSPERAGRAGRLHRGRVTIDGVLDEPVWSTAPIVGDFVQRDPAEGQPSTERTEVRVLYTASAVYFGITAYDSGALADCRDRASP